MSLTVLCSASGAPGATTAALALLWTWPQAVPGRRALLVDADPAGSSLLPHFLAAGIPAGGGVLGLAAERGTSADAVLRHAVSLDAGEERLVLTGFAEPAQARPLSATWTGLAEVARDVAAGGLDVLVDAGRIGHRWEPSPLIEAADVVAVVTRSTLTAVTAARSALRSLRESRGPGTKNTALVVGRPDPYTAAEVATALEVDPLPALPLDPAAAGALARGSGAGWRFARSPLLRAAGDIAASLAAQVQPLAPRPSVGAP
ncbi:MAG: hypothetical protein KQH57_08105 [Actinomycetales bacterium]|nr:hypothetical protein [Actinomycetales bacterium]